MSVEVVQADISTLDVDVIVNAANEHLRHGGGVAGALAAAGGETIQQESDAWVAANGPVGFGQAAVTTAGTMAARNIVHVVGPRWSNTPVDADRLSAAVAAALHRATVLEASSVAIPAISTGIFGGPLDECTQIIAVTASTWATAAGKRARG